jgi:hypothetical protein
MLAVLAGLVVLGGTFAITQLASAEDNNTAACAETASANTLRGGGADHRNHRRPRPTRPAAQEPSAPAEETTPPQEPGQGEQSEPPAQEPTTPPEECEEEQGQGGGNGGGQNQPPANNGLDVLGRDCEPSNLQPHNGFQEAPRCVSTAMGEVAAAAQNPSLLITNSPRRVRVNQGFTLQVSTRNLVRDRFLGAAAGGYYLESSFLNGQGLQRGHFHVACRMLGSTRVAPNPEPAPAFFRAVEDGGGGAQPDTVRVDVTGMPTPGTAQCAVWAGDGSHRMPMMERANQTPAFDIVRIIVSR